jgi:SpoVK/Ycf46/Vps4 family AAA+-type ATPase
MVLSIPSMESTTTTLLQSCLFEIAKIIEGATASDVQKVTAYAQQLSKKFEENGEPDAAKRIRQVLGKSRVSKLALARAESNLSAKLAPSLPVDSESRLALADEDHLRPEDVQVFLRADVQRTVNQLIACFRAAGQLAARGVGAATSMLMFGPPGCGKTQLARYIAAQLELPLLTARSDALISSYLGSTSKNVRLLFEHAMSRPCVLFLDEFDAVAKMRDDTRELGELKRVVISLLQNIDSMGHDHVLLAATNHEHLLDKAIWRRFNYRVHLAEPDEGIRSALLRRTLADFANEEMIQVAAALSKGMTGAQVRQTAQECVRSVILEGSEALQLREIIRAFVCSNPGAEKPAELSVGDEIRLVHKLGGKLLTQARLAEIFGMSQPQISRLLKEPHEHTER